MTAALAAAPLPITQAFLIPFAPLAAVAQPVVPIEPIVAERLRKTTPGSALHLSLVEVIRRRYIAFRKDQDRRNKEAIRRGQQR
jgi:hypothetical protein